MTVSFLVKIGSVVRMSPDWHQNGFLVKFQNMKLVKMNFCLIVRKFFARSWKKFTVIIWYVISIVIFKHWYFFSLGFWSLKNAFWYKINIQLTNYIFYPNGNNSTRKGFNLRENLKYCQQRVVKQILTTMHNM